MFNLLTGLRYFLLTFIMLLYWSTMALGINTWVEKASFTGIARTDAVSFVVLDKAYVGTGQDSTGILLNDFWEYNPNTDSWTQLADFAGTARTGSIGFAIDSAGYIGLGRDSSTYLKDLWKYDPFTNAWTPEQDLGLNRTNPSNGRRDAAVAVLDGAAFVVGGYDGTTAYVKQCWRFDPNADTSWAIRRNFTNATDFGVIGRRWGVAFSANSSIYFGTGYTYTHDFHKDLWKYNPFTDSWSQVADMPGETRSNAVGFTLLGRGYIACGGNIDEQYDMWSYNTLLNLWNQVADYPGAAAGNNIAFVIQNHAYVGLGNDNQNNCYSDLWQYTPDSTTSIGELNNQYVVSVYPNPGYSIFNVRLPMSILDGKLSLINSDGKTVLTNIIKANQERVLELNLSGFQSGTYFLLFENENTKTHRKLIKY